jgi:hypothetical protein
MSYFFFCLMDLFMEIIQASVMAKLNSLSLGIAKTDHVVRVNFVNNCN